MQKECKFEQKLYKKEDIPLYLNKNFFCRLLKNCEKAYSIFEKSFIGNEHYFHVYLTFH